MTEPLPPSAGPPPLPPSALQAAAIVWRDVHNVLSSITNAAIVALVISVLGDVLETLVGAAGDADSDGAVLVAIVLSVVQAFLMTPYLLAVYRFIILGEVATGYRLEPGQPRFQKFFGWSMVLSFGAVLISMTLLLLPLPDTGRVAVGLAAAIGICFVSLRILLLLPAVAVDSTGATPANAWGDTEGHAWRIFLIVLVTGLPLVGAMFVLSIIVMVVTGARSGTLLEAAAGGVLTMITITVYVALSARLYLWLGRRVKAPRV